MAVIRVPGFGGNYVVDTGSGHIQRVAREGGLRNPLTNKRGDSASLYDVGGQLGTEALRAIQAYGAPMEGGGGGGGGGGGMSFSMSPQETELMNLQIESIREANRVQKEILARENARRAAYNRFLTGEKFTPTNMEEEQGLLAARAGKISGIEQERLEKALAGNLPVSPSTERGIKEGEAVVGERLRRNLGPGYATSSPGIEQLTKTAESAEILRDADRKDYIQRGITPAVTSAQFAQNAVGQYLPGEVPGLSNALAGMRSNRQMSMQQALGEGQLGLGYAGLQAQDRRAAEQQASDYINSRRSSGSSSGGGWGALAGLLAGGAASYLGLGQTKKSIAQRPSNAAYSLYG